MEAKPALNIKQMVIDLRAVRDELDIVSKEKTKLEADKERLDTVIAEYLMSRQAESTEQYPGIGFVKLKDPKVKPNISADNKPKLLDWFRELGLGDLIKTDIHYPTLSSELGKLIKSGADLPEYVDYYLQPKVTLYRR